MKALVHDEFRTPASIRDVRDPEPASGQVRIKVSAAGLNPFDAAVVSGRLEGRMQHHFPLIPGMDASGIVDAVADDVTRWAPGDEVFGSVGKMVLGEGTLAEHATMSAGTIARKPDLLEHSEAAAIPVAGVTALIMADALSVSKEGVVIAIGATGGVGSYFVQIAAARGADVVAVTSSANAEYARSLGATAVIDYSSGSLIDAVTSRYPNIDAIVDMHGDADAVTRLSELIRADGQVISAVGSADLEFLAARNITGTNVQGIVTTDTLENFLGLLERTEVRIPELRTFPFADAAEAMHLVGSGHVRGKIVVLIPA